MTMLMIFLIDEKLLSLDELGLLIGDVLFSLSQLASIFQVIEDRKGGRMHLKAPSVMMAVFCYLLEQELRFDHLDLLLAVQPDVLLAGACEAIVPQRLARRYEDKIGGGEVISLDVKQRGS